MGSRDDVDRRMVCELWCQGFSAEWCASQAGVSAHSVHRWVRAAGLSRSKGRPLRDPKTTMALVGLLRSGVRVSIAAQRVGVNISTARYWERRIKSGGVPFILRRDPSSDSGGVDVDMNAASGYRLNARERQEIALGRAHGDSPAQIARRLGRSRSTITRELARNTSTDGVYRFLNAEQDARCRARRPKPAKLAHPGRLRDYVVHGLEKRLSPEQIVHRLRLDYPYEKEMNVCAETIYQAMYLQARGGLKREVVKAVRNNRVTRKPHSTGEERRGRISNMVSIRERPDDVEDRLIPGHWEGDLIMGSTESNSAIATLVERSLRLVFLVRLPHGHTAGAVAEALIPVIASMPETLRRSLTWDQGHEMAHHLHISEQTGIAIYFADPRSPWQRGTNENTNGLLREYFPKGTDLSIYTDEDLTQVASEMNSRPRKTLGWLTPAEAYAITLGTAVIIGGQPMQLPDNLKPLALR